MPRNLKISGAKKVGTTKRIENGFELKLRFEGYCHCMLYYKSLE